MPCVTCSNKCHLRGYHNEALPPIPQPTHKVDKQSDCPQCVHVQCHILRYKCMVKAIVLPQLMLFKSHTIVVKWVDCLTIIM